MGGTDSKREGASKTNRMFAVILPMTLTQDTFHQAQVERKGENKRMFILSCRVTQFTRSNSWHYSGIFQSFHFLWHGRGWGGQECWGGRGVWSSGNWAQSQELYWGLYPEFWINQVNLQLNQLWTFCMPRTKEVWLILFFFTTSWSVYTDSFTASFHGI